MSTKLETETYAGATIQSWKDQATKAGLVLRAPSDVTDSGDFRIMSMANLGALEE